MTSDAAMRALAAKVEGDGDGTSDAPKPINSVTLSLRYSTRSGYSGTEYVRWSTDGVNWNNTSIRPTGFQTNVAASFDLKAAGVDTWSEVQNLRTRFYNGTSHTVGVDYLWVAVE